jgi:putative PIN family toxin of toxin-antitoxin system
VRLVLDTNVVLSGLLWTGSPMRIIAAAQAGEAELFTSRALLGELYRCLARAKFARQVAISGIGREELFFGYVELATALAPQPIAPVILADPADDHVLACALAARAHAIVSGDRHLLALAAFRDIPVLTPADALARIAAGR